MANIKLEIEVNKGKAGISLDKLERIVKEMRRFLDSLGDDIELINPDDWLSHDFTNGSLGFTTEYPYDVAQGKVEQFNETIIALAQSDFPPTIRKSTANIFFDFAETLEQGELASFSVFGRDNAPVLLNISKETAIKAKMIKVLPFRRSLGSVQGKIHSLYKESKPSPWFYLRELSTENLIKCNYQSKDYAEIIRALAIDEPVMHVRGTVVYDTRGKNIHHVDVEKIQLVEGYDYESVRKFLHADGA